MTTNSWLDYYQEQRKRIADIRQRPIVLEAGLCGVELVGKHLRYFVYMRDMCSVKKYDYDVGICNGAKNREECTCGGDTRRCDFLRSKEDG